MRSLSTRTFRAIDDYCLITTFHPPETCPSDESATSALLAEDNKSTANLWVGRRRAKSYRLQRLMQEHPPPETVAAREPILLMVGKE
jgi:hypothetical protein